MQSSSPCIPPAAWSQRKPSHRKNFGTNSFDGRPSDLGGLPTGPGSDCRSGAKETREQRRSPKEVIRRRVDLAGRCSRGSERPYSSLAARAGQNQWLLTGQPCLATVKGRPLFLPGITIPLLFCSLKKIFVWMKSSSPSSYYPPIVLQPLRLRHAPGADRSLALGEPVVPRRVWISSVKLSEFLLAAY